MTGQTPLRLPSPDGRGVLLGGNPPEGTSTARAPVPFENPTDDAPLEGGAHRGQVPGNCTSRGTGLPLPMIQSDIIFQPIRTFKCPPAMGVHRLSQTP